ncbi:MAG: hypothetical protein ACLQVF_45100 [Isosphaeraceae bacterium]
MLWHRIQDLVPAGFRSLFRRASARSSATLRREGQAHDGDASRPVSVHPDCPSGFRFEFTTQQISMPDDCMAISTVYRSLDSLGLPSDPELGMMDGEATMPRRLLLMVHELHRRGYERLRAATGLSPSGCYWRCCVTPVSNICRSHGALVSDYEAAAARYSSSDGARCFGWPDAVDDSPGQLATKFLDRFVELSESRRGRDGAYARWYCEMLRSTEPGGLIYAYADWELPGDGLPTLGDAKGALIPLPPPGEAGIEADSA